MSIYALIWGVILLSFLRVVLLIVVHVAFVPSLTIVETKRHSLFTCVFVVIVIFAWPFPLLQSTTWEDIVMHILQILLLLLLELVVDDVDLIAASLFVLYVLGGVYLSEVGVKVDCYSLL